MTVAYVDDIVVSSKTKDDEEEIIFEIRLTLKISEKCETTVLPKVFNFSRPSREEDKARPASLRKDGRQTIQYCKEKIIPAAAGVKAHN